MYGADRVVPSRPVPSLARLVSRRPSTGLSGSAPTSTENAVCLLGSGSVAEPAVTQCCSAAAGSRHGQKRARNAEHAERGARRQTRIPSVPSRPLRPPRQECRGAAVVEKPDRSTMRLTVVSVQAVLLVLGTACATTTPGDGSTTTPSSSSTTTPSFTTTPVESEDVQEVGVRRNYHSGRRPPTYGSGSQDSESRPSPLLLEYAWKKMDFAYPSESARREAIRSGKYNSSKIIALDVDVWEKGGRRKVFVTMPSDTGVPATLATVSSEGDHRAPLMAPYPDWGWHRRGDCNAISSVYRVAIDEYDRLWVLDRGDDAKCMPKLMVFDLETDRLLSKYEFSRSLITNNSNLITPVVDVRDGGRNTFVYIADVIGGLIVYDHQTSSAWRVNHPIFLPDAQYANHNIAGSRFYLPDGVFGMALSPACDSGRRGKGYAHSHSPSYGGSGGGNCDEDRTLYFHALASVRENYVKTSVLRDRDNFPRGQNRAASSFKSFDHNRPYTSAASAMSEEGVLFTGLLPDLSLMCWNSKQPFKGWNIEVVAKNPQTLQFTSGMKVRHGRLWVMSCRYQRFITQTMNWNEVNYRVQSARVADLITGTKCDPKTNNIG